MEGCLVMMRDLIPLTKSSPDSLISLSSQSRQLVRMAPIVDSAYVKLSLTSLMVSFMVKVWGRRRENTKKILRPQKT